MKKIVFIVPIFFLFFASTIRAQESILVCQKNNFEQFIRHFAELDKEAQLTYVQNPLVEKYDDHCQTKTRRAVIDHVKGWTYIIPNKATRQNDKVSYKTQMEQSKGIVLLYKNDTWLYGRLEFSWQNDCWHLSAFQFDLPDPNECAGT